MSPSKRGNIGVASPLEDVGVLLHVLSILGPGQHLFVSAVSKAWRESYEKVGNVKMANLIYRHDEAARLRTITAKTTLCSAIFCES
jgi:hypothetical protein